MAEKAQVLKRTIKRSREQLVERLALCSINRARLTVKSSYEVRIYVVIEYRERLMKPFCVAHRCVQRAASLKTE